MRHFAQTLKLITAFALTATILSCSHLGQKQQPTTLSILQGATSETMASFTVVAPKATNLTYQFSEQLSEKGLGKQDTGRPIKNQRHSRAFSKWAVDTLTAAPLTPGKDYVLSVFTDDGKLVDERFFTTYNLQNPTPRFAVISCMDDSRTEQQAGMWSSVAKTKPGVIFMIGDTVYADKIAGNWGTGPANPENIWSRFVETRNSLEVYLWKQLIPTLAIWDDHDYGHNNAGREYQHKDSSKEIFRTFFYTPEIKGILNKGPGISFSLLAHGQRFLFVDNRSFRSPVDEKPQTHWGQEQEKWVLNQLNSKKLPTWLIQGDQFFGAYHRFESYEGQRPKSFKKIMGKVAKSKSPVVMFSGDRHLFELMSISKKEFGYQTYEITTSGIHSKLYPGGWLKFPNHRKMAGSDDKPNFVIVESQKEAKGFNFNLKSYGPNQQIIFNKDLLVRK